MGNREGRGFPKVTEPARAHLLTPASAVVTKLLTAFLDVTLRGREEPRRRRGLHGFTENLETEKHKVSLHFQPCLCSCSENHRNPQKAAPNLAQHLGTMVTAALMGRGSGTPSSHPWFLEVVSEAGARFQGTSWRSPITLGYHPLHLPLQSRSSGHLAPPRNPF